MKTDIVLLLIVASTHFSRAAFAQTVESTQAVGAATNRDEQALIQIERQWCAAFLKGDADYINSIMAPTYIQTNIRGEVTTKTDELGELRAGEIAYERFETSDLKVQVYHDAAVVTGQTYIKGKVKASGRLIDGSIRITDTFIREAGTWRIVASQTTLLPKKDSTAAKVAN